MARPCHGRQQQQQHMRTSTLRSVTLAVVIVALVVVLGTTLVCAEAAERGRTRGGARRARQRRERPAAAAAGGPGAPLSELPAQLATRTYTRTPATLKAFRTWFARAGGWTHKNVKFQLSNQYGVRLIARRDIPEADELVRVPEKLLLSAALLTESSASQFDEHLQLTIVLLDEVALGKASNWYPWIAMLPSTLSTAAYFSDKDLEAMSGSYARIEVQAERNRIHSGESAVLAWASKHRMATAAVFTPAKVRWAYSLVTSRAFSISKVRDTDHSLNNRPFLAPAADFLNHSPDAHVGWVLGSHTTGGKAAGGAFQIFTRQAIALRKGKNRRDRKPLEVFNMYQPLPNSKLLSRYGFALPENPDDFLPMALDIPHAQIGTELGNYKTAMLRSLGLDAGQSLGPGGPSVRLQNVVRVLSLRHVGELDDLAPDFNVTLDLIPVSHVVKRIAADLVTEAFTRLLGNYDMAALDHASKEHRELARIAVESERSLLLGALEVARTLRNEAHAEGQDEVNATAVAGHSHDHDGAATVGGDGAATVVT